MSSIANSVAVEFDIRAELAERIVADIEDAIADGHTTATELWANLAHDYTHQLEGDVELDQVIEYVAHQHGLTAHLV